MILSVFCNLVVPDILKAFHLDGGVQLKTWEFEVVLGGFLSGLLISEFIAIGFWILLDTMSVSNKLVAGLSLGVLLAACLIVGTQVWSGFDAALFILILGVLMPLAFAGIFFGLARLLAPRLLQSKNTSHATERSRQFGIGYLMVLMVFIAVLLSIIRYVMPLVLIPKLELRVFIGIGFWSVWLVVGTSVFAWFSFAAVVRPSFLNVVMSLWIAVVGPSIFQWIASFFLVGGGLSIKNPQWFDVHPQSISFGILAASLLIGLIVRNFHKVERTTVGDGKVPIGTAEP